MLVSESTMIFSTGMVLSSLLNETRQSLLKELPVIVTSTGPWFALKLVCEIDVKTGLLLFLIFIFAPQYILMKARN